MTRLSKFLVGFGLLAAGFVTLSAFEGNCWHHGGFTPEKAEKMASFMVNRLLDDVKADDQQRTQINAIKDQRVRDTVAFFQGNKAIKATMLKEWDSEKPDAKNVHALIDQRIDELRKMAHQAADDALEVHEILRPDQRAQVSERIRQHIEVEAPKAETK